MNNVIKMSFTAASIMAAMAANAKISVVDNEKGNFSVGGNVELNFNYQDRESNVNDDIEHNQDGRVLIEFSGEKHTSNGYYVGVKAQPLLKVQVILRLMMLTLNSAKKVAGQSKLVDLKLMTCFL